MSYILYPNNTPKKPQAIKGYLYSYLSVTGITAALRDHTETVMAVLVGGEMDSVNTTVWKDRECMMECVTSKCDNM